MIIKGCHRSLVRQIVLHCIIIVVLVIVVRMDPGLNLG